MGVSAKLNVCMTPSGYAGSPAAGQPGGISITTSVPMRFSYVGMLLLVCHPGSIVSTTASRPTSPGRYDDRSTTISMSPFSTSNAC